MHDSGGDVFSYSRLLRNREKGTFLLLFEARAAHQTASGDRSPALFPPQQSAGQMKRRGAAQVEHPRALAPFQNPIWECLSSSALPLQTGARLGHDIPQKCGTS